MRNALWKINAGPSVPLIPISEGSHFPQGQCSVHGLQGMLIPRHPCQRGCLPAPDFPPPALDFNQQFPAPLVHLLAQPVAIQWISCSANVLIVPLCTPFPGRLRRCMSRWPCWDRQFPALLPCTAPVPSPAMGEAQSLGLGFLPRQQDAGCSSPPAPGQGDPFSFHCND